MPTQALKEWISKRALARELEICITSVDAVVSAAEIQVKRIPGLDPRYSRDDVLRVKSEAISAQNDRGAA